MAVCYRLCRLRQKPVNGPSRIRQAFSGGVISYAQQENSLILCLQTAEACQGGVSSRTPTKERPRNFRFRAFYHFYSAL